MRTKLILLIAFSSVLCNFASCGKESVFNASTWDMKGSIWESKEEDDLILVFDSHSAVRCYFLGEACGFGTYKKSGLNIRLQLSAAASYKVLHFDTATLTSEGKCSIESYSSLYKLTC